MRCSGASFFSLEYWVERLVQLYKRMIKYRSTACPELLFIHDLLLYLACQQLLRTRLGHFILSMTDAIRRAKARPKSGKKRKGKPAVRDEYLLGKGQDLTPDEVDAVLPQHDAIDGLNGLPYLLYSDRRLHELGWPAFPLLLDGVGKLWAVLYELGLPAAGNPGDPDVRVVMHKFTRATLPVGDTVSSVQCKTQRSKDNRWCHVHYTDPDGDPLEYIALFQYFVLAHYKAPGPKDHLGGEREKPQALRLAVMNLYECEAVRPPGSREADQGVGRHAEMYKVVDEPGPGGVPDLPCRGQWVVPLDMLQMQLVPTKKLNGGMYFMWANKASGRTGPVQWA